jgi:hypothetical protein
VLLITLPNPFQSPPNAPIHAAHFAAQLPLPVAHHFLRRLLQFLGDWGLGEAKTLYADLMVIFHGQW